jgi:hypothetical protein
MTDAEPPFSRTRAAVEGAPEPGTLPQVAGYVGGVAAPG